MFPRHVRRERRAPLIAVVLLLALLGGAVWQLSRPQRPVLAQATYTLIHPRFPYQAFGNSGTLTLHNEANSTATVSIAPTGGSPTTATIPALGTLVHTGASLNLSAGFNNSVIVTSDQPVRSVVLVAGNGSDALAAYEGIPIGNASTSGNFGAIYKNASQSTAINLLNTGSSVANAVVTFYNLDGGVAQTSTFNLPPGGTFVLNTAALTALPSGYVGWARYTSDQPLVGLLQYGGTTNEFRPALGEGTTRYVASALRTASAASSTEVIIINPGASAATATLRLISGAELGSTVVNLPAANASVINLSTITTSQPVSAVTVEVSSTAPIALGHLTPLNGATYLTENAPETSISVPYLVKNATYDAGFVLYNAGSSVANVVVSFYNAAGDPALSQTATIAVGATRSSVLGAIPELAAGFEGSATISSDQPLVPLANILYSPILPTATATSSATPTVTATTPTTPTATIAPSPTPGGTAPVLYLNYSAGAPGSSFLVGGYNLAANRAHSISVNGVAVGSVTTNASGAFTLLLATLPGAAEGIYVVAAVEQPAGSRQVAPAAQAALGSYRLTRSGPDAVVRAAPPDAPATSITVPTSVPALASAPNVALPLVAR